MGFQELESDFQRLGLSLRRLTDDPWFAGRGFLCEPRPRESTER